MRSNDSRQISRRGLLVTGGTAATLGAAGCLGGDATTSDDDEDLSAVNGSFFMLYDLARNVAGDTLRVEDLVPAGAHGDDWEPSPGMVGSLRGVASRRLPGRRRDRRSRRYRLH